jgi:DnaJ-class molecular chaperone
VVRKVVKKMGLKDVFETHEKNKRKKSKNPLEELINTCILKGRKKKPKNTETEKVEEICKWCEGTGINPKDKKKEKYCRYCGGSGKVIERKKKTNQVKERLNNTNC